MFKAERYVTAAGDRLHAFIYDILIVLDATQGAMDIAATGKYQPRPTPSGGKIRSCLFPDKTLAFRTDGLIEAALHKFPVPSFEFGFVDYQYHPSGRFQQHHDRGLFVRFNIRLFSAYFMQFFEQWADWLRQNISADVTKWPPACQFGRVVRNAFAHSGRIKIDNRNATPVSWYALSYDHNSNGRVVLGSDISPSDLIVLMCEICGERDYLRAPQSLIAPI